MRGHRFVHGDWQQTKGELPRNAGVTVRVGRDSKLREVRAGERERVVQQGAGRHGVVSPIFVPLRAPRGLRWRRGGVSGRSRLVEPDCRALF
ncbi:hypothetical protein K788_0006872 [Paraburkholderia caribensis MBA4]|uniref:Uncharacterized protein n=1 Tax=Paraburkholderia caribensis MBA4 TaxID=1323664 RepID=A0A0N7JTM6_9BURK|nr:hypothetical protein K788_0006872 [Paraburkholderia caribensis MBA4]